MTVSYDRLPVYSACSSVFTPGATPQDVFTITGSATNNILVLRMGITTFQTTAGLNGWRITKRSTANTGGTSSARTNISWVSTQPAPTATVLQYTANPTAGTLVGDLFIFSLQSPDITGGNAGVPSLEGFNFETLTGNPIALLSVNEVLAFNFNGAALPAGLSVSAFVQWAESPKT